MQEMRAKRPIRASQPLNTVVKLEERISQIGRKKEKSDERRDATLS